MYKEKVYNLIVHLINTYTLYINI